MRVCNFGARELDLTEKGLDASCELGTITRFDCIVCTVHKCCTVCAVQNNHVLRQHCKKLKYTIVAFQCGNIN